MQKTQIFNLGSIHDIPVGRGLHLCIEGENIAVFRDTYGSFYALEDEVLGLAGPVSRGVVDGGKVRLRYGKNIDLHTGQCDETDHFIRIYNVWVENVFIFIRYHKSLPDEPQQTHLPRFTKVPAVPGICA